MAEVEKELLQAIRDFTFSLRYLVNGLQNSITDLTKTVTNLKSVLEKLSALQFHDTRLARLSVAVEPSFSDVNDVPKRALVDADRHVQADVSGSVSVSDVQKVSTHRYLPPTSLSAGGTAAIWTPAAGKAIRCKRIQVSVDAATRIDLRWGTLAFESYFLPANGSIIVNLIGTNQQGPVDTPLTILSSAAATVTASADGDEV